MEWTSGYRADIDYTYGYYRELAPSLIDFALIYAGFEPPPAAGTGMRYLELGYGQGVSANIHAAATPGEYWGADFNPVHAANAQGLARISGAAAHFSDESFEDLAHRDDLPPMDYIVLHGIWSWVSDENRRNIVEIVRKRLKVGGAVYMSYNTLPGWAVAMPLRHMMTLHAGAAGSDVQGVVARIDASIAFGQKLAETGARYFAANPNAKGRLDSIAGQNRHYVAHEYFNRDWAPMYFSDAHEWLADAKLSYAGSASLIEQMDGLNLSVQQRELLGGIPAGVLRETVRDYMLNTQFRRDLYSRGARGLSPLEKLERLKDMRVTLVSGETRAPDNVETNLGKMGLRPDIYGPVVDVLAANDSNPKTIGEMGEDPKLASLPPGAFLESLGVLVGASQAHPVQSEAAMAEAEPRCRKLNAHLIERARVAGDVIFLASPLIGAGVGSSRFEMIFLGARAAGRKKPEEWAKSAWETLQRQNQSIIKNGEVLTTAEANLDELTAQAKTLAEKRLPLLQRLKVVD
jgi:hypothetical protein